VRSVPLLTDQSILAKLCRCGRHIAQSPLLQGSDPVHQDMKWRSFILDAKQGGRTLALSQLRFIVFNAAFG
jgi:hypothetical protein